MNTPALRTLLGLRYRLLWAMVRTGRGKATLFFIGYIFVMLLVAALAAAGSGAAWASIRTGQVELAARAVLSAAFSAALVASVMLGFGMRQSFSDAALRRYPLTATDRMGARQLSALLEPLWLLVAALYLGLALGLCAFGPAAIWLALPAAVMLVIANYLLARLLASLLERLLATRTGPFVLMVFFLAFSLGPSLMGPNLRSGRRFFSAALGVLQFSPPFVAAEVMANSPAFATLAWFVLLAAWCLGLATLLFWVDGLPIPSRVIAGARAQWDGPCDRVAAFFGASLAPLVSKMLRYYIRSPHLRHSYPLAIPLTVVLLIQQSRTGRFSPSGDPMNVFLSALGIICIAAFMSTGAMVFNVFGIEGRGFRRYFLLPIEPGLILRAAMLTPCLLGAAQIPVMMALWIALAPVETTPLMALMLFSNALGTLLLFQVLGIWTSLLMPREAEYNPGWGGRGSKPAVFVMMAFFMVFMILPGLLRHLGAKTVMQFWWVSPLFAAVAAALFWFTVHAGAAVFAARRERMLALVEGRG